VGFAGVAISAAVKEKAVNSPTEAVSRPVTPQPLVEKYAKFMEPALKIRNLHSVFRIRGAKTKSLWQNHVGQNDEERI
jgi:hypothetical protein